MPPLFPATMTESVAPVTVRNREPIVIAPPLAGPNWLDGNSCCDMTPHRMALNPISGEIWLPSGSRSTTSNSAPPTAECSPATRPT